MRAGTTATPYARRTGSPVRHDLTAAPVLHCSGDRVETAEVDETWTTPASSEKGWADAVLRALDNDGSRAFGALSFEPDGLGVMHRLSGRRRHPAAEAVREATEAVGRQRGAVHHETVEVPSADAYAAMVSEALAEIARGRVEKVVLGRHLEVRSDPPLDPAEVVARLLATRPGPYVFRLPVPDVAGDSTLLGASPELLVRRTGTLVESTPLAGSVPRSEDPAEDSRRRAALARSEKDLHEHRFVVRDIVSRLRGAGVDVPEPGAPVVIGTDTLWHLATPIAGHVAVDGPSALHLAQVLHPTPAVGGSPTAAALDLVRRLEPRERGWMAGAVGWVDGNGDGEFALTLRSGQLHGDRLRLFAGAGIVAGSRPADEVRETGAKLGTMARAVGL